MKYKISVILCAVIILVLSLSYLVTPEVTTSETERRNMRTFGMIFEDIDSVDEDGEPTIINNVGISIPDRLENAMKDQIFVREDIMSVYNGLQTRFANLYSSTDRAVKSYIKSLKQASTPETTEPETTVPVTETTVPTPETTVPTPETTVPSDDTDVPSDSETVPAETTELETTLPETTERVVEPTPIPLDFEKYPGYGYARLDTCAPQSYEYRFIGDYALYNGTDYVGAKPNRNVTTKANVQKHVNQYEMLREEYPNLKFYAYFVTQIQDTPWFYDFYGRYPDRHETIAQFLPEYVSVARLTFEDFDDYMDCYFKSDHHWNYKGSERAYRDVYTIMADDLGLSPMKTPIKTWNFTELEGVQYRGSRANALQGAYSSYDEFIVYEYDLGERETFVLKPDDYKTEIPVTMGLWERYKMGVINKTRYYDHYINFYGHSYDEMGIEYADSENYYVIKNNNDAEHSLLLVCDSSQRAYRDVLASHFKNLVTLDYRVMTKVPVDYLIEKYDIDVILIGAQGFAWSGNAKYMFTFSENFGK